VPFQKEWSEGNQISHHSHYDFDKSKLHELAKSLEVSTHCQRNHRNPDANTKYS